MAIGRISGPLLKANLIRDGVDLAFETDLLYIDVNNSRIGVKTSAPTEDLHINGTTKTTDVIVDNELNVGSLTISGNTLSASTEVISFVPSGDEPVVYHSKLRIDDFEITGNTISTYLSNSNIELNPNGSGTIELQANSNITGNLYVTGNIDATGDITIGGDIIIGDNTSDNIIINASIKSDLIPETTDTYDLGSPTFKWRKIYADELYSSTLTISTLDVGNLVFRNNEITTTAGQDLYIDGNGAGAVRLANFRITSSTITNITTDAVTEIQQTGIGYFRINGTNGFVPPVGTDAERPTPLTYGTVPVGMTRYNSTQKAIEVWDGLQWASPAGVSGAISEAQASDIALQNAVIL